MEIFIDFPGKINEKFQVFKSKSSKNVRTGGPETRKRLADERETQREGERGGWGRKQGEGEAEERRKSRMGKRKEGIGRER